MIRMSKQVGGKFIAVPYRTSSEIAFDGVPVDAGPAFFYDIPVECPDSQIRSNYFTGSPKRFGFGKGSRIADEITGFHLWQIFLSVTVLKTENGKEDYIDIF